MCWKNKINKHFTQKLSHSLYIKSTNVNILSVFQFEIILLTHKSAAYFTGLFASTSTWYIILGLIKLPTVAVHIFQNFGVLQTAEHGPTINLFREKKLPQEYITGNSIIEISTVAISVTIISINHENSKVCLGIHCDC